MSMQERNDISNDVFEVIRGIVVILDSDGRITRCNPYLQNLTGYTSKELIDKDWFATFIPQNDQATIRDLFKQIMSEGFNDGYSNFIMTKDGEQRLIEWYSKTLNAADGQITGMLCTGFDVTERATIALELEKSKQDAMAANQTKTRFLAAASHDLRQPLQALGLYMSVLSKQSERSKQEDLIDKMRKSLDTMGELIDSLLNISKLDKGGVTADMCDVHLQELLDRVVINNTQQAISKGLQLECNTVDHVVYTDPKLLERMIENLVTNAIRYTEQGHVKIECLQDKDSVRVTVSDTGIGIPESHIESVFEEYYQIDNQSRDRRKGLGLGLSIVKHLGRILDHSLDVSSSPGKGSTFAVEIPLGEHVSAVNKEVLNTTALSGHHPVVLFVEDDPVIVEAATMFLSTAGMKMHSALNGDEAIAIIEAGIWPDIIVSDYRLPKDNGVEVIRRVRNATLANLPAILLTGDICVDEINKANLSNCTVLQKPVESDQLIALISHLRE
jgi:PAS domain S-box-containing protein